MILNLVPGEVTIHIGSRLITQQVETKIFTNNISRSR